MDEQRKWKDTMKYIHKGIGVPEEKRQDCEKIF